MSKTVYAALLQAQKEMGPLYKNATNPHYRSSYADLATVIETVTEALHKNGLVVIQTTRVRDDGLPLLVTTIAHESGETISGEYPLRAKDLDDPQKLGAAMTYARRYALMGMLFLAAEDDDGNLAAGKTPATPQYRGSTTKPPSDAQKNMIASLAEQKLGVKTKEEFAKAIEALVGKSLSQLTSADATALIDRLKGMPDK